MIRRKIAVVIGSRANYASIKSVMKELLKIDDIELQVFVGASAILDKYGKALELIKKDGFKINESFYMLVEGETPETMSMSTGLGIIKLTGIFMNHKPDIVITVGDRFETMATAISAAYLNIHLAHTMGGEVSGTIDESIRHAVTKFAHIHFPANQKAAERIIKMGENPEYVFVTGCPRIDVVKEIIDENRNGNGIDEDEFWNKYKGVGSRFSFYREKFLLVMQHPVTTEFGKGREQIRETLMALNQIKMPTIMLWPNADAGSDEISKEIRTFREKYKPDDWLHLFKNLPMEIFVKLMDMCACMVGNSSSAIREGAIIGVPAVNIGTRQQGRERGRNVLDVDYDREQILEAINSQIKVGKYDADYIYGDGKAGERIAKCLAEIDIKKISIQKRILV
jgi:UDP-hydrolysing UDP-N-acetyl-D-glucosamine 2-epimerase